MNYVYTILNNVQKHFMCSVIFTFISFWRDINMYILYVLIIIMSVIYIPVIEIYKFNKVFKEIKKIEDEKVSSKNISSN